MIVADSSAWIDFFSGKDSFGAVALERGLTQGTVLIPPIVLVEILSFPRLQEKHAEFISLLPRLELTPGYWERCASARKKLLTKGLKCRLGDCLIAQSCMDQDVLLISEDEEFRHFEELGLKRFKLA